MTGPAARFALAVSLLLAACAGGDSPTRVLRVSAIPDQKADNVMSQHWPVVERVCAAASVRCEWAPIDTYEGVVDALGHGQIDLAYLGGATYSRARREYGVSPLVVRDVDTRFSSTLVVRARDPRRRLADLRGARFLFGNAASTSGHVMARHFLGKAGIDAEAFFGSVSHAPNHDATLEAVAKGAADAGVVNSSIAHHALGVGGPYEGRLVVIWESPAYMDYVWAARPQIAEGMRQALVDAFLDLDREDPRDAAALAAEGAGGFLPATDSDYDKIGEALREVPGK